MFFSFCFILTHQFGCKFTTLFLNSQGKKKKYRNQRAEPKGGKLKRSSGACSWQYFINLAWRMKISFFFGSFSQENDYLYRGISKT